VAEEFPVVFAIYPRVTQLDFTGPHEVLARLPGAQCILASSTGGDLEADGGLVFTKVRRLADIERCALVCVPGGFGTIEAMEDQELLAQLRRLAKTARYVTSVCTGALVLGAAGLLRGKRATSHWAWRDALSAFGAIPDSGRVVRDGNVFTGGGVTAGIDLRSQCSLRWPATSSLSRCSSASNTRLPRPSTREDQNLHRHTFLPTRNSAMNACAALATQPSSGPRRACLRQRHRRATSHGRDEAPVPHYGDDPDETGLA